MLHQSASNDLRSRNWHIEDLGHSGSSAMFQRGNTKHHWNHQPILVPVSCSSSKLTGCYGSHWPFCWCSFPQQTVALRDGVYIYIYICICISLYRVLLDTYYFLCKLYSHPIAFPWTPGKSMVNPSTFSKIEHPWLSHHLWCLSHHSYCLNYHFYCLNLHFLVTKNCPKPPFVPKAFAKRASKRTPRDMEAWTPAQSLPRKKTPSSGESLKRVTRTQLIFCVYSIDMYVHRYIVIYIYIYLFPKKNGMDNA